MNRSIARCVTASAKYVLAKLYLLATLVALLTMSPRALRPLTALTALSILLGDATLARSQIVQLPSQHVFSSSGSVVVPDGGTTDLGGIGRSSQGSVQSGFGPFSNRASGGSATGSTMSVSVRIIDLDALDEAILAGASPQTSAANSAASTSAIVATPPGRPLTAPARSSTSGHAAAVPGQWQRVLSGGSPASGPVNLSLLESDIRYYVQQGERAERAGSYQAAQVYFQLARNAMTPELADRYQRAVASRTAEAAARLKAEQEAGRRKF